MDLIRSVAAALLLVSVLAGCGGSDDDDFDVDPKDAGFRTVKGEGFTIGAAKGFTDRTEKSSNGEPMLVLETKDSTDETPVRVAVIRDVNPQSSAENQSNALVKLEEIGAPKGSVTREKLDEDTWLIKWKKTLPGAAATKVTYWQLMEQVDDDLILNVVAIAPTADFKKSQVSEMLRTFDAD